MYPLDANVVVVVIEPWVAAGSRSRELTVRAISR
jgi:hypothetical protein